MATLKNTTVAETGAITLPVGTTAQRPGTPQAGDMRFNDDFNTVEYYDGSIWRYQPDIVRSGLVLHLDAGEPDCFKNGDTSCINLVSGGSVTGASGTPGAGAHTPNTANFPAYNSVNGGVFDFAGGKGMNVEEDLGPHTSFSLDIWYYKNSSLVQYFTDARNDGGQWFLSNYDSYNITYTNAATYNFNTSYNASNPDFINRWQHLTIVSDASGSRLFIDSSFVNPLSNSSLNETLGKNFRIGTRYTTSAQWTGYMGAIKAYNRALSAAEVYQNFQALRGRYGI